VRTAAGVQYTRNGQFSVNSQGLLVDQFGDQVLSKTGASIKVGSADSVPASALGVFKLTNPSELGNNNFTGTVSGADSGNVEQGKLEASGVDPIHTMVAMTSALEAYQAGQQSVQTIAQTMQESASTVGLVPGGG
jgi:flagellar basal body rod protein FlgG